MARLERIFEKTWDYIVFRDSDTGEYFLNVLCGTIAMYDFTIRLDESEIASFEKNREALEPLARKISYSQREFLDRQVKNFKG